jgi:hypothetical protein
LVLGTITIDVSKFVSGIWGTLRFQSGNTSLAMTLLDNVEIQYNKFVAFVEKYFKELTTVANFPSEFAWKLLGHCLGGFFQTMVSTCSEITLLEDAWILDTKAQVIGQSCNVMPLLNNSSSLTLKVIPQWYNK